MRRHAILLRAMGVSAIVLGLLAPAQLRSEALGPHLVQSTGSDFAETDLRSFAMAALDVADIRNRWVPQIKGADSEASAKAMQSKAMGEMAAAIQRRGLSVASYNAIAVAADESPELRQRIVAMIKEIQ